MKSQVIARDICIGPWGCLLNAREIRNVNLYPEIQYERFFAVVLGLRAVWALALWRQPCGTGYSLQIDQIANDRLCTRGLLCLCSRTCRAHLIQLLCLTTINLHIAAKTKVLFQWLLAS